MIAAIVELVDVPALVELYRAYTKRLGREFGFAARPDFIDAETIPFVDVTSGRMLAALEEQLREQGIRLLLARDVGQVRDVLRSATDDPSLTHVYPSVQAAVDAAQRKTP